MITTEPLTLLRPDDTGYDEHRIGFQTHQPHRPALVALARTAEDVASAVRRATREDLRVSVQATGHGVGAVDPGTLLVDTSGLTGVRVDPAERTATVAAGTRWAAVVAAAAEHGLAPLSGSSPGVGAVGYLVNGGLPILGRSRGWAAAGVRDLEVVTADGERRRVTPDDDGLGWALRGGGGSFALVTEVTVALVPLDTLYAGALFLPVETSAELARILRAWRDWAGRLPDATSTSVAAVAFPDVEGAPPPLRGRTTVAVRIAHDGPVADGPAVAAPMRAVAAPLLDDVRGRPWTDSGAIHRDPPGPAGSTGTTLGLTALDDAALDAVAATFTADDEPGAVRRVVELRRLGGALGVANGLPVRHDAAWTAAAISVQTPATTSEGVARSRSRDAALRADLADVTVGRVASFLGAEAADPEAVRAAYRPADWDRLRAVKAAVDPEDRIRGAAPVPPA